MKKHIKPYFIGVSISTAITSTIAVTALDKVGELQGAFWVLLILKLSLATLIGLGMAYGADFIYGSDEN